MTRQSQKNYCVRGLIINKRNFFESDTIITILTLEKGIISCVVRGSRKPKSKLSGITELFIYGDFFLAKGKKLDILTASTPKEYFQNTKGSLEKISHFFLISEVLDKLLPYEIPNEKIFNETLSFFQITNKTEKTSLVYECIYKNLVILGYGLSLKNCPKCYTKVGTAEKNILDLTEGGVLCDRCKAKNNCLREVSEQTIKLLNYIEKYNIKKYSLITFNKKTENELEEIINSYLNHIYQRKMKSPSFIRAVQKLQKSPKRSKL